MFLAAVTVLTVLNYLCKGGVVAEDSSIIKTDSDPKTFTVDLATGKQCHSSLSLPPGYDHFKPPGSPMDIIVQYEIRQVRQVHEETMSYDLHLQMMLTWTDRRLIGLTERVGCNPVFVSEGNKLWVPGRVSEASKFS